MGHLVSHVDSKRVVLVPATTGKDLIVLDCENLHDTKNVLHMKNITTGVFINVVFSRTGDRIYGLSNELDPCLIIWDGDKYNVIGRLKLPCPFIKCLVSPLDHNKLVLIGNNGLYIVTISELLNQNEEYVLPIKMDQFNLSTMNITTSMLSPRASDDDAINTKKIYNSIVTCALWTHDNTVVIGNKLGHLLLVDPYKNTVEYLTKLPSKRDNISIPTSFALTITNLIIGTSNGHVFWYSSDILLRHTNDAHPLQSSNIFENITTLIVDPGYDKVYIGTASGTIEAFRASVSEKELKVDDDDLGGNDDGGASKHNEIMTQVNPISSKKYQDPSVICVTSFTCKTTGSSVSIYVTGSNNGIVNFWKQPSCEPEPISAGDNRVRKSNPSNLQLLSSINTNSEQEGAATSVVLSLEVLFSNNLDEVNLFVGYADGHVEVWDVTISDMDDEEEYSNKNNDDEIPIKIAIHTVASFYISTCGVSMISACHNRNFITVGSHDDRYMYVLQKLDVNTFDVVMYLTLQDDTDVPTAICWCDNNLFIGSKNGTVYALAVDEMLRNGYTVFDDSAMVPSKAFKVAATSIHTMTSTSAGHILVSTFDNTSLIHIDVTNELWTAPNPPTETKANYTVTISEYSTDNHCNDHDNYTISTAISTDHQYFATGSVDGTVYIWNVQSNSLITKVHLHKDSVIGLVFSKDSSLLLSCSVDGSIFILGITRASGLSRKKSVHSSSDQIYSPGMTYINDGSTWLEQRNYQYKLILEKRFESKKSSILTTVGDITSRLNSMVRRNTEKDELEKMERSEFVVDIAGRDLILADRKQNTDKLKSAYDDAVLCNELIAARLRSSFWDTMEAKSTILLPLTIKDESIHVYTVSSIPVRKLTDDERAVLDKIKLMRAIELRSQRASDLGSVTKLGNGQYRIGWKSAVHGCPGNISWIHNEGTRWPCANLINIITDLEKIDEKSEKKDAATADATNEEDDEGSVASHEVINEVDDKDLFNLLYAPQGVRTATQKKIQIELLKEVVRAVARKYNEAFEKLRMEKEDVIASVDSRNVRLTAIMEELKISESLTSFKLSSIEKKGNEINVDSSIIKSKRYETEAELAARLADEERKRRDADSNKDDAKGRALQDMMNGTLETKKDVFAEANAMVRPAWMDDIPRSKMNEAQVKEFDAFEAKIKQIQEDQIKYNKSLEIEYKKLKSEIIEVTKQFDDKLLKMSKLKVLIQREIYANELYMARLGLAITKREQLYTLWKKYEGELVAKQLSLATVNNRISSFKSVVDDVKHRWLAAQEEEKNLEKTFKRDLQTLCNISFDQDTLKIFTQLYRKRKYPKIEGEDDDADEESAMDGDASKNKTSKSGSKASKTSKNTNKNSKSKQQSKMKSSKDASKAGNKDLNLGPMQQAAQALHAEENAHSAFDPFHHAILQQEREKLKTLAEIPLLLSLSLENDCPDGLDVDQFTWSQLQDLRNTKIKKEIETKTLGIEYADLKKKLDVLCKEEAAILSDIEVTKKLSNDTSTTIRDIDNNVEVIVCLRQGQDEVDKDAIVTSYKNGVLLPSDVVHRFNTKIKSVGNEKINVLTKIKEFRRKINLIDWEVEHLKLEAHHYEEYFTDLQLLRVTRELQSVIREGSNAEQAKQRMDKINARKDLVAKNYEMKISQIKNKNQELSHLLHERSNELKKFDNDIHDLTIQVLERKKVKQSRDDARGKNGDIAGLAAKKMHKIIARRQLVDTAKSQAEEIDLLRQELDKIHQKTFPSFVRKKFPPV